MSVNIMKLVYEQNWTSYEEWGGIRIYEHDECFYVQYGGYSVMGNYDDPEWGEHYIVAASTVLELIDEWEEIAKGDEDYWNNNNCG